MELQFDIQKCIIIVVTVVVGILSVPGGLHFILDAMRGLAVSM